mmetsp:Transcript_54481/g.108149  ORF Transcript_54481/g.108149 Transcript_54481/m.108149 type:complete len:204 (-) Transcript_54481:640-1251(-)
MLEARVSQHFVCLEEVVQERGALRGRERRRGSCLGRVGRGPPHEFSTNRFRALQPPPLRLLNDGGRRPTKVGRGQLAKLVLEGCDADCFRQGHKEVKRLLGFFAALWFGHRVQRPHVVHSVRQLHQHHVQVQGHGLHQAALVAHVVLGLGHARQGILVCHPRDDVAHRLAKALTQLLDAPLGVLRDVVQQPSNHRVRGHLHLG